MMRGMNRFLIARAAVPVAAALLGGLPCAGLWGADAPAKPAAAAPATKPAFDIRSPAFGACVDVNGAGAQKLAGGMKFIEGPVWVPGPGDAGGFLVFSDIPANALMKWDPAAADAQKLSRYREPSDYTNGNAIDAQGRLLHACHGRRALLRTTADGKTETLADKFEGKALNSPNDLVLAGDGAVYFTDPPYGVPKGQPRELDFHGVYRLSADGKSLTLLSRELNFPNGVALSPDGKTLYVARSDPKQPVIRAFAVQADGSVDAGKDLCKLERGSPDGIRVDAEGRIWSSGGDGVSVFSPAGELLGKILVPEAPANLAFGGKDGRTLFITARTGLYVIPVKVTGAVAGVQPAKPH